MNEINFLCPAKLNLDLKVLGKRADGMHEIQTQFQLIDLYDEMQIKKNDTKSIQVKTNAGNSIEGEKNIVFKAITALSNHAQRDLCCDVDIDKKIPMGGGLGGGSSNAAGALIGLNKLFDLQVSSSELMSIGQNLGADVPFFIYGKNAQAFGIGEKFTENKIASQEKYLLLHPNIHSSTKDMFLQWDELSDASQRSILDKEKNSFLTLFLKNNHEVQFLFKESVNSSYPRLSGTGSTIFYAYKKLKEIEKTFKKIPTKWRHSFCEPLQCSPLLTYLK